MIKFTIKKRKTKECLFLVILMCGLLFGGFLNFNLNFNISNTGRLYPYFNKITQINLPEVSNGYSSSYNNTGDSINVTLHQSNLETGTPLFVLSEAFTISNNGVPVSKFD
jgi:hypothetical protein